MDKLSVIACLVRQSFSCDGMGKNDEEYVRLLTTGGIVEARNVMLLPVLLSMLCYNIHVMHIPRTMWRLCQHVESVIDCALLMHMLCCYTL
jgi:hypothetical protein